MSPATPERDQPDQPGQPDPSDAALAAAVDEVVEQTYLTVMRHEPQLRRLSHAFHDLGIPMPEGWARFDGANTVSFAPLNAKQFRRFISLLEDVVHALPDVVYVMVSPDDQELFEVITAETAAQNNNTSNASSPDELL